MTFCRGAVMTSAPHAVVQLPLFLTAHERATIVRTTCKAAYAMVERGLLPGVARGAISVYGEADLPSLDQQRGDARSSEDHGDVLVGLPDLSTHTDGTALWCLRPFMLISYVAPEVQ